MTTKDDDPLAATAVDESSPSREQSAAPPPGTKIGRFTVIEKLGAGGMGLVVAAYDPELDRKVAIKMLHDHVSAEHGVRLEREAKAMAQLNDPHVVTVHETGTFGARLYVAMEYVAGQTFRQWLREKPRTRDEILDLLVQAARGLAAAHAVGLVHRDFKPDNVLVGNDGRVRVSDFGLVSSAGDRDDAQKTVVERPGASPSALTQTGQVMGTPLYMAPEQHGGKPADAKADQFSFCVTLWQALCDDVPYGAASYQELVDNVTGGKLRPMPRGVRVPARLRAILARGLAADPAARWPSMTALIAAIERARRPVRWPILALAGVALAGGGVAAALLLRGEHDPCGGGGERVARVWDPPHHSALVAHFGGDAPLVAAAVDRYARAWAVHHREVCEATQSPEALDLRMHCMDERLAQLEALLARFGEASSGRASYEAIDALSGIPPLADCDDTARLRAAYPLPSDPNERARIADLDKQVTEAISYDRMGRWGHANELLAVLEPEAKATNYPPLLAKIVLLRAGELFHDGQLDGAMWRYRDAAELAAKAKDDERIAQAWTDLVSVHAARGKYDDALALVPIARTSVERVSDRPLLGARFHNAVAGIYLAQGKYPEAKAEYASALELVRSDKTDNELVGPALVNYATALWYVGDAAGAARGFEEGRAWFVQRYGPKHPSLGYVERDLGDLAAQRQDLAGAIPHYQESLAIFEGAHGKEHIDNAIALEPLCYAYAHSGKLAAARAACERALALREKKLGAEHASIADTLLDLSDVDVEEGTKPALEHARGLLVRALAIAEKAYGRDGPQVAKVLDRAAVVEQELGALDQAYAFFERSLAIHIKATGDHGTETAQEHMDIGHVEAMLKRYREALADYARAEEIFAASNPQDPEVGRARFGRAEVLAMMGRTAEAVALAKQARAIAAPAIVEQIDRLVAAASK